MLGSMFSTNAANSPPPPSGSSYKNKNGQAWLVQPNQHSFPARPKGNGRRGKKKQNTLRDYSAVLFLSTGLFRCSKQRVFDPCFVEDRFPEMPVEFFQEELLMRIGNRIGRAVKVDETTMAASRGRYARVCVEVDLTKPLVSMITLLGFAQAVEYEGLHQICFDCGKYGQKKISAQTQKENPL
ncbi:UNVERIFIED_CONTAM: hypothetical protein Scaly_2620300 [Sesamum calycinum]|uniref:Uncharacterized protein n=1 Tax=Sesamum calycinum TaxID=2727403 RepID=A0AAW2JBQ0_9LAMI